MGKQFDSIKSVHKEFIEKQHVYFVATAASEGKVNVSPKGMDSLRVMSDNRVLWLNLTGSGNETAAHLQDNPRMTIMFCAFEGKPMILRLYGTARAIHSYDSDWEELSQHFPDLISSRQIYDMTVAMVQTSCGFAVPFMDFVEDRPTLIEHWERKGEDAIETYWEEKNQRSLDNQPTHILKPA